MDWLGAQEFKDVTHLFEEASQDMATDELFMVNGFTLNEAMSAVEIGDPRMDSGAPLPTNELRPEFDPLKPLLPEEVCWILDRSMACEMHWHAGNALAQTVFTCLYMFHLSEMDLDSISSPSMTRFEDAGLPVQLVSMVIRAGIMGLLKCCDMSYRELIKGSVHDCEDWQGEKSDTSLLENKDPQSIVALLEEAELWLTSSEAKSLPFHEELLQRIQLRKTLLRLFSLELPRKAPFIMPLLFEARQLLTSIKGQIINSPLEGSSISTAFDPRITRQLHSIMPMRPLVIPPQTETWKSVEGLLDGWELIYQLSSCENLLAWNVIGTLRACNKRWTLSRPPFIRSLAQGMFSNGASIMDRYAVSWVVDHFFLEIAHIDFRHLVSLFDQTPSAPTISTPFDEFHNTLPRYIVQHIWASYHNRPRQRRFFMKSSLDWHVLYDSVLRIVARTTPQDSADSRVLKCMPLAILHWRAWILSDIILSGFELELHSPEERPFAYWYLSKILETHEAVLKELLNVVPEGTPSFYRLQVQSQYVSLMKEMAIGCFMVLCHPSEFNTARRWTNFTVRYKWILRKKYIEIATPDPFLPDYHEFLQHERNLLLNDKSDTYKKAKHLFESALDRLMQLPSLVNRDVSMQLCRAEFTQHHLTGLILSCEDLRNLVSQKDDSALYHTKFIWDLESCPWFPHHIDS